MRRKRLWSAFSLFNLLEKDLGLKLFIRTHRRLVLTEAGKSLYKDAKYIIQYCKESVERAKKAMEEKDNIIRIGTSPMTPANMKPDNFIHQYPLSTMQAVLCLLNIIVYFWLPHPLFLNIIEKLDNIEYRYYTQSRNIDTRYLLREIVMKAGRREFHEKEYKTGVQRFQLSGVQRICRLSP